MIDNERTEDRPRRRFRVDPRTGEDDAEGHMGAREVEQPATVGMIHPGGGSRRQLVRRARAKRGLVVLAALSLLLTGAVRSAGAATHTYTVSSFTARGYGGISPADLSIAVGPTYIVETINTALTVYTKAGAEVSHVELGALFAPATSVFCVDPTAIYNAAVNRYALTCTDIGSNHMTRLAVSATGDPTGAWHTWSAGANSACDQPSVEITKDKLVVAGALSGTTIWVYQLSDVLAGAPSPRMATLVVPRGQYRAVEQITPAASGYLTQAYPNNDVYLGQVTGTPATGIGWREIDLGPDTVAAPHAPSIPGGFLGGGYLDGRVLNASYEVTATPAKVIVFSQMASCGSLDCNALGRITLTRTGPTLSSLTTSVSTSYDQTYGAAVVDGNGQVFEAYTRSSPTQAPQAAIFSPAGLNQVVRNATPGTTACHTGVGPPCNERWGDYLGAARDPSNPSQVWLAGLYQTASGDDGWQTVITSVTVS